MKANKKKKTKLLLCPFCGEKAFLHSEGKYLYWYVACGYCISRINSFLTKEMAIEIWNRRTKK